MRLIRTTLAMALAFSVSMGAASAQVDPIDDPLVTDVLAAIFDRDFYLEENSDVSEAGVDPFSHFLANGLTELRSPSTLFNQPAYLETNTDVAESGLNPLLHYVRHGAFEGRSTLSRTRGSEVPSIFAVFDTGFYLSRNPDVAGAGQNPLAHYVEFGASERRDPTPWFNTSFYVDSNPDVAEASVNPLSHFVEFGAAELRDPSVVFDSIGYLERNPDVAAAGVNPVVHYLQFGGQERRSLAGFSSRFYLRQNPDVVEAGVNPLVHYNQFGVAEGRDPFAWFDLGFYLDNNADVADSGLNPLEHFLTFGSTLEELRSPSAVLDLAFVVENSPDVLEALGAGSLTGPAALSDLAEAILKFANVQSGSFEGVTEQEIVQSGVLNVPPADGQQTPAQRIFGLEPGDEIAGGAVQLQFDESGAAVSFIISDPVIVNSEGVDVTIARVGEDGELGVTADELEEIENEIDDEADGEPYANG